MTTSELIKTRRTIRKFQQKPISNKQIEKFIDLARVCPSGSNIQPLKYVAVTSKDMADKVFPNLKWAAYLAPNYTPKEDERPTAYIIVCADTNLRATGFERDEGAAVQSIILSALEEGIGSCWFASVDRPSLKKLLNLDDNIEISTVLALGYPSESPKEVSETGDIKYYLDGNTLCVPKRSLDSILIDVL